MAIPMFRNALLAGTGLALLAATPAGAQTQDCQQRLDRIEASLEEVELSQAQLGEFRDIIGGARTLAEQGSTERCLRVVEELNTVLADLGVQVQEGEGAVTAEAAIGGQGETEVLVEQPRPRVVVQQQPPVVNVQVPEPQVSVRVPSDALRKALDD